MRIIQKNTHRALVSFKGKYYVVSDNYSETLVFPSDSSGNIIDYCEVGGGRGLTLNEVLENWHAWGPR